MFYVTTCVDISPLSAFSIEYCFTAFWLKKKHYNDVIMTTIASKITILTIVYSCADQRKHQSSASLAFVREIHRRPVNSRTKGQERGKCFHLMTSSWNDSNCICVGLVDGWAAWWPTSVRNLAAVVLWRECYGGSYPGGRLNIKVSSYQYRDPHVNVEAETKWTTFRRRHFETYFLQWKCLNFD